jgi:hypothetical protein
MICGEEWIVYLLKETRKRFGYSYAAEFNSNIELVLMMNDFPFLSDI